MLRCSGDLELGPEWLRFLWLSAAAEKLGVEFDRSGLHGWLAIRRLRRREAEMYERREAEAERKAVAERERRDAEDRERRKEAERAQQWRRAEEKRRIATQQDEMREREACKREDEEAARAEEERVWKEEQVIHDEAQRMEEEARRLRRRLHASAVRPRSRGHNSRGNKESKPRGLPSKLHIVTIAQFGGPTDALKLRHGLFQGRIPPRWAPLV